MSLAAGRAGMSGHYIRKRLRTAIWAWRAAVFAALLLVAAILVYRLGGVDFAALKLLFAAVAGLAGSAILVALGGLLRAWRSGREGGGRAVAALFMGLLVAAPFASAGLLALDGATGNAAETDGMLAADTVSQESLGEAAAPVSATDAADPVISGRRFPAKAAQVYAVTRLVLAGEGWEISEVATAAPDPEAEDEGLGISGTVDIPLPTARSSVDQSAPADPFAREDSEEYAIKAVARGPVLALPSDVTIRIVEDDTETFVDLRSVSRIAGWDLGQNRRLIEGFLARLDEAMAGVAAVVPER